VQQAGINILAGMAGDNTDAAIRVRKYHVTAALTLENESERLLRSGNLNRAPIESVLQEVFPNSDESTAQGRPEPATAHGSSRMISAMVSMLVFAWNARCPEIIS
jgi:hypothetical protein